MVDTRIAIVGAGNLSTRRIYPYIGAAGSQLVGVCDLDYNKAEENSSRFGGEPFNDLEQMLHKKKPDGVIVCVGPEQHYELALRIIKLMISCLYGEAARTDCEASS